MTLKMTWVLVVLALAGCKEKEKCCDTDPATDDDCSAVTAVADETVANAVHFSWSTESAGTGKVEYGLDGALDMSTTSGESGTDHALTVPLLKAGHTYSWRGVVETDAGDTITCATQEIALAPEPQGILGLDLTISDPDKSMVANGYVLFTTLQATESFVGLIDGDADYVFTQNVSLENHDDISFASVRAKPGNDGKSIVWNVYDRDRIVDVGGLRRVDVAGGEITSTRTLNAHHDFLEHADGTFAWLAYDLREDIELIGDAPAIAATACGPTGCPVASDMIFEGAEGSADIGGETEVMNLLDGIDFDPFWICSDSDDYDGFVPGYFNWSHGNSLIYEQSEDAYYLMSRHLDALFKIDRSTGNILWQLGGVNSDFAGADMFAHGHYSHHWPGGFLVFDNGDHKDPEVSRVAEFAYDEQAMTVELVWEQVEPSESFIAVLGDARRLSNGNTLIDWSAKGRIQEVTPDHEVVWEAEASIGGLISRVTFIEGFE